MKKIILFSAISALALSSCTSEEVVDVGVQSNPIGFENAVMKQSRAGDQGLSGDLTNATFDKFIVYGYYTTEDQANNPIQVFSGEAVTKNSSGTWSYTNTRYWVPGATYHFFAYSCADVALDNHYGTVGLSLNASGNERQMTISNYQCNAAHNHDLIVAQARSLTGKAITSDNKTPNQNVTLQFGHVLTKIDAVFTSEFSGEYDVVIKDVRIVNFRDLGSFSSNNTKWTAERSAANVTIQLPFTGGEGVANAAFESQSYRRPEKKAKTGSIYMIPYNYQQNDVQLVFSLDLYKGEEHTPATLVLGRDMKGTWSPNWEPGKYYTYNIRLTGTVANLQPIVFETTQDLNGWESGSSTATDISFSAN